MSVNLKNIAFTMDPIDEELANLNVTFVDNSSNSERASSTTSEPRPPSRLQSFVQKAKQVFSRPAVTLLSFEELHEEPLYALYEGYIAHPSKTQLKKVKSLVKELGYRNPVVSSLRTYAEELLETLSYTQEAKELEDLVQVLGGSPLSHGGTQKTRMLRKRHKRRGTKRTKGKTYRKRRKGTASRK